MDFDRVVNSVFLDLARGGSNMDSNAICHHSRNVSASMATDLAFLAGDFMVYSMVLRDRVVVSGGSVVVVDYYGADLAMSSAMEVNSIAINVAMANSVTNSKHSAITRAINCTFS